MQLSSLFHLELDNIKMKKQIGKLITLVMVQNIYLHSYNIITMHDTNDA